LQPLHLLIIIVLSINSLLASTLNNQRLISLNDSLSDSLRDNALVICTGSKVKLISAYHYFELGEIKELSFDEVQANTSSEHNSNNNANTSIDCPTNSGIQLTLLDWIDANPIVSLTQWFAVKVDVALQLFAYRSYYLFFTSRAPPTFN
jgi:hypothetical protein